MNRLGRPDDDILLLQGINFYELEDYERSDKAYKEADRLTNWQGPLFNLAFSYHKRGLQEEALETVERALKKEGSRGACLTLKAMCLSALGREREATEAMREALRAYDPPEMMIDWELGWYMQTVSQLGDEKLARRAESVRKKRRKKGAEITADDVPRPVVASDSGKKD